METLTSKNSIVKIDKGELISFTCNGNEFIHQKGNKGWRKSDDEMFPVIGPTSKNNFRVHTAKGDGIQDQHGLLRELAYETISVSNTEAIFKKEYKANTKVVNSKFPKKSSEEYLNCPFDFSFFKKYTLQDEVLTVEFKIQSEENMPFMLGYHPAFLLSDSGKENLISNDKTYTLADVYKKGSNALLVPNSEKITLQNINKENVEITTESFQNFMLWTEVDNMLCIEPITHYPIYSTHKYDESNMLLSKGKNIFKVRIAIVA